MTTRRSLALLLVSFCAALGACQYIPGLDLPQPTPEATGTEIAGVPTFDTTATAEESPQSTSEDMSDGTPRETPEEVATSKVRNTPVVMDTPVRATKTPRPRATPTDDLAFIEDTPPPTPRPTKTPKPPKTPKPTPTPKPTKVAMTTPDPVETALPVDTSEPFNFDDTPDAVVTEAITEATPETIAVGPEVKVASLSFKPGTKVSLVKVDATSNGPQSIVKVELSAAGKYKILPLPSRRQVCIDFELVELTEPKTVPGSGSSLVKEISARSFESGIIRVVVQLKDDGQPFPVIGPKKRAGEAAMVEVTIGTPPE